MSLEDKIEALYQRSVRGSTLPTWRDYQPKPSPDLDECPHCEGQGAYWDDQTGQPDEPNGGRFVTCHVCGGEGIVDTSPCIACGAPSYDHEMDCPLAAEEVR